MPFFKAATPGTLLVLAGTVLMVLVTLSSPIIKSIYLLEANFSGSGGGTSLAGNVHLGVLGYCSGDQCASPTLGYELDPNDLLGVASDFIDLPNNLIRWLTYVLVLHPVGAGLGLIALLCGLLGHIREFSIVLSLTATWLASLAGTITLIAFIFDMVVFTLVKNRINDAAQSSGGVTVDTAASYGNALWMTLAAFILFTMSGCCFKFGRRVARERKADRSEDKKPNLDPYYANQARLDAEKAEGERLAERGQYRNRNERGLPSFAENMDTSREEQIPLRSYEDNSAYADPYADQVPGVGVGYGRRAQPSRRSTGNTSEDQHQNTGYRTDHEAMPSHAESFTSMNPYGQQGNQNLMPGGYQSSTTPVPYLPNSSSFQRSTTPVQSGMPYQSSATPYRPVDASYQNAPYQPSTTPYQSSSTPYQPSSTPYQPSRTPHSQSSVPYQPASTPAPYVPAPAPAAYAAYNQVNDSPPRARTYGLGQGQQSYDAPRGTAPYQAGSRAIPYSDPTYDYDQPSYVNQQDNSYGNSSYQTAPQGNSYRNEPESYDNPPSSSAYGGMDEPAQDYENPYYHSANEATDLSRNASIGTALPRYQSEADSHALPMPGSTTDQAQLGYGHSTETPMRGGRQRSLSPRGPRQMSSSFGQATDTNQSQQYESRY